MRDLTMVLTWPVEPRREPQKLMDKKRIGLMLAQRMGHQVSGWMRDQDKGERLAQCEACDRFMAIDPETPQAWGWIIRNRCPRRRMA
jgi:hypothetical protein